MAAAAARIPPYVNLRGRPVGKSGFIGLCERLSTPGRKPWVVCDKIRGLEILVRALGGDLLPSQSQRPCRRFQTPTATSPKTANVAISESEGFVRCPGIATPLDQRGERSRICKRSARWASWATLDRHPRGNENHASRLSSSTDFATRAEGIQLRLARWARAGGTYAWVFDQPGRTPLFAQVSTGMPALGIIRDVTETPDNAFVRSPVTRSISFTWSARSLARTRFCVLDGRLWGRCSPTGR